MWRKAVLLYYMLFINSFIVGDVGDRCIPNDKANAGSCVIVTECEVAIRYIKENDNHPFRRCGFLGDMEIVCCPHGQYEPPQGNKKKTSTSAPTVDKFGENSRSNRLADRECKKIVDSSIPPLALHIIGGETAGLGEFPHMAALGYERSDGYDFQCGGSLVSDSYILTAAHCVDTLEQIKPTIARMGVIDIAGNQFDQENDVKIADILLHPSYARKTKYHDLALLRLEKSVQLSMNLNPICLYTSEVDPPGSLTVTGWGKTSNSRDTKSTTLLKANVTVVANSKCGESYTNWRKLPVGISKEQICAGDPQGLKDTCQGDSGGPLQGLTGTDGQYRLVGVTSFGRGCGSPVPGVYTRISHYLDWIESVVWPQ